MAASIVTPHPYTVANRGSIIILAARHRLPAIYPFRYFAAEGGLISYGPDQIESLARSGNLRRSHPARARSRAICRFSADQVRAGRQPQDREGAWVDHPACISAARRRGDRIGADLLHCICRLVACAVKRRRFPVGARPTRQPLQPEATGAVMEVTKWLKPSDSVSRYTVTARVCRP